MTISQKTHFTIIALVNFFCIFLLLNIQLPGNEKGIHSLVLTYPLLTFANAVVWFVLEKMRVDAYKVYRYSTIILALLFIPNLILACM